MKESHVANKPANPIHWCYAGILAPAVAEGATERAMGSGSVRPVYILSPIKFEDNKTG